MNKRRKRRRPRVDHVVPVQVPRADFASALVELSGVRRCAACHAPARHSGRSLYINHIGDCPALADPRKILDTDHA